MSRVERFADGPRRGSVDSIGARAFDLGHQARGERWLCWVAKLQGVFYFVTGVWPILHLRSFFAVTGPKTEYWLVQTFGAVLAIVGIAPFLAARHRAVSAEVCLVGAGTAAILAVCDLVFVGQRAIGPVYLLDAAAEAMLVAGWVAGIWVSRRTLPSRSGSVGEQ